MAFCYNGRNLPPLDTYDAALKFWQQAKPWRDGDPNERPLDLRRKTHVTIRQTMDGNIACKLHNTDVVTFHPNGDITLRPWMSVSTDEFANRLLPNGISTSFNRGYVYADGKFYRAINDLRFDKKWQLLTEPVPFTWRTVNRKQANAALKGTNYKQFSVWVRMVAAMEADVYPVDGAFASTTQRLADSARWPELLRCAFSYKWQMLRCAFSYKWQMSPNNRLVLVDETLNRVRDAIYAENSAEVYDKHEAPFLTSHEEVARWSRSK